MPKRAVDRFAGPVLRGVFTFLVLALAQSGAIGAAMPSGSPSPRTGAEVVRSKSLEAVTPSHRTTVEQNPLPGDRDGAEIRFEQLSLEQGLSQSSVFAIMQDASGFLWFGTQDGLNKYDGYEFTVYRPDSEDPNSLGGHYVRALAVDSEGALWIGTFGDGLDRLDRTSGQVTHYENRRSSRYSLSSDIVLALYADRAGTVWIGTQAGLNRYDRERDRFVRYRHVEGNARSLSHDVVRVVYEDRDGVLWLGTEGGGLDRFDRASERFTHYRHYASARDSLGGNVVLSIHQDREGLLWVGTDGGGLSRLDPSTDHFDRYQHDPGDSHSLSHNTVSAIFEDSEGVLWIGTQGGGLNRFDRESGQFIRYQHVPGDATSLSDDWILSIYEDRGGVLWIGTVGGGLNLLDRATHRFRHYQSIPYDANSLGDDFVWAIYEDREGIFWIGTYGGGLDRYEPAEDRWTHYRHDPSIAHSLGHDVIRAIRQDARGFLWIGTDGEGLDRFDPQTERFSHYRFDPEDPLSLSSDTVLTLHVDPSGAVWIGTGNGLNQYMPGLDGFFRYQASGEDLNSLSNGVVRSVSDAAEGCLWVGTDRGLNLLDPGTRHVTRYRARELEPDPLTESSILSVYQDGAGVLWLGTFGQGLVRFDPREGSTRAYRDRDGLPSNVVYGILEDDQGSLWLSTNYGLSQLDPQTETFQNYDSSHGLQSNEFNAGAYWRAFDGAMYFGGVNGFSAFYPDRVTKNPYQPPVVLTHLTQGGAEIEARRPIEAIRELTLRWPNNYFDFGYAALSYSQSDRNQYAYMLEGLEDDWIYVGTQRAGRYTNLPGRSFTLRIRASNSDGVWNPDGLALKITVIPPFWETWLFRSMVGLLLVAVVVTWYRLRVRGIEVRSRRLEAQVEDRTREIEQRRQELEALYRADEELYRHLELDDVLQALVDIAVNVLNADKSSVICWNDAKDALVMRVARGFRSETMASLVFSPAGGLLGRTVCSGEPAIVEDAATDPRHRAEGHEAIALISAEGIRSFMYLPIQVSGESFGVFSVSYTQPHAFGEEEQRLFTALAQRAAVAIQNAQLYQQSHELAVVEERSRLARDLHDAVTQTLFSASLISEALPTLWETDQEEGQQLLAELRQLNRGALAEMRTLLLELRPVVLAEASLGDLLRQLGEAFTGRTGVLVSMAVDGLCELPSDVHVALYRIAQEALNNVAKHAQAQHVSISLHCLRSQLVEPHGGRDETISTGVDLCVGDDGRGFDLDNIPPDRLGLGIIRERAEAIGAKLSIDTEVGKGTEIRVKWNPAQSPPPPSTSRRESTEGL